MFNTHTHADIHTRADYFVAYFFGHLKKKTRAPEKKVNKKEHDETRLKMARSKYSKNNNKY